MNRQTQEKIRDAINLMTCWLCHGTGYDSYGDGLKECHSCSPLSRAFIECAVEALEDLDRSGSSERIDFIAEVFRRIGVINDGGLLKRLGFIEDDRGDWVSIKRGMIFTKELVNDSNFEAIVAEHFSEYLKEPNGENT